MTAEPTQRQSDDDQQRAQDMSLQRTRPPTEVPGYEPRKFLGAGAYGEVWVALDQNTGRRVAIKFYAHRGGVDWTLLAREVEKLVFLSADRYVVQLLDVGWNAEPPYYVMEYIENGSLEDRLRRSGPLAVAEAVELFREVAIGLSHAHGKGVLHCDLKPANVLLDQDQKPRLADFGQSRLSYEQSPALGTLFYMAPEQADLQAVPDVRWDVYALGALLYCMLTGQPPHHSEPAATELKSAADLADRLARYRHFIRGSPAPVGHRQVRGVDRALADIVSRCLAVEPEQRLPNVHSVVEALDAREQARTRRPLVMLGFVGPALLLVIMLLFSWRGYQRAVGGSEQHLRDRVVKSNEFAAKFAAQWVASKLHRYQRAMHQVAQDEQFQVLLAAAIHDQELQALLAELGQLEMSLALAQGKSPSHGWPPPVETGDPDAARFQELLAQFQNHPQRQPLQQFIDRILRSGKTPQAASWFVTNTSGSFVAAAFKSEPERSVIGWNYAWRTYFHGGPRELDRWERPPPHNQPTHLSAVYQSEATNTWKAALSTPVQRDGATLGVIALTIELGNFMVFPQTDGQFAVLVDARDGANEGVILEHPLYLRVLSQTNVLPQRFRRYRVRVDQWQGFSHFPYYDPLAQDELGKDYRQVWVAAMAPVQLTEMGDADRGAPARDSGWVVLVQEDYQAAATPVLRLGRTLVREGLIALGFVLVVIVTLWYLVVRFLAEPTREIRTKVVEPSALTPLHSQDTVELPPSDPRRLGPAHKEDKEDAVTG